MRRRPGGAVAVDPLHEEVESALRAHRVRVVDDGGDDKPPALVVDQGPASARIPRACRLEPPCRRPAVLKAALHVPSAPPLRATGKFLPDLLASAASSGGRGYGLIVPPRARAISSRVPEFSSTQRQPLAAAPSSARGAGRSIRVRASDTCAPSRCWTFFYVADVPHGGD